MGALGLVVATALAAGGAELEKARLEVSKLQFAQAQKTLSQVTQAEGLSRAEVLALYELSGIVAASLGDTAKAHSDYLRLVCLDPGHKLKGSYAPKITTPFFEAKAEAKDKGTLSLTAAPPELADGKPAALLWKLSDPCGVAKTLAVQLDEDGVTRQLTVPAAPLMRVAVHGAHVKGGATVLTTSKWTLSDSVTATADVVEAPAPPPLPPAVALTPRPEPTSTQATAPPVVATTSTDSGPRLHPLAYMLAGVGLAGVASGAYFGVRARNARAQFESATSGGGVVTTITRSQALALDAESRKSSLIANISFAAGATLVAAGAVVWVLGWQAGAAPSPGGGFSAWASTTF